MVDLGHDKVRGGRTLCLITWDKVPIYIGIPNGLLLAIMYLDHEQKSKERPLASSGMAIRNYSGVPIFPSDLS